VLAGFRLTYEQFVEACMLMGSDYSEGSMEPREAIEAARGGAICNGAILKGEGVAWADIVSQKQQGKWITGPSPVEPETIATFQAAHKWPATWVAILSKP
jgi:hypothetical protein